MIRTIRLDLAGIGLDLLASSMPQLRANVKVAKPGSDRKIHLLTSTP